MLTHRKAAVAGLIPEPAAPLIIKGFKSEGGLSCAPEDQGWGHAHPVRLRRRRHHHGRQQQSGLGGGSSLSPGGVGGRQGCGRAHGLLLGFDYMGCFPVEADHKGSLALWSLQLGTQKSLNKFLHCVLIY